MTLEWGYNSNNGPTTWPKAFPSAAGERQSPVDISPQESKTFIAKKLSWKYIPENVQTIGNSGYSWVVNFDGAGSELTGGPLDGKYILEQFHCHWGAKDDEGSEHTINGTSYAGELHLVHWNSKYSSFGEAAKHPDGLCVLGIFLKPGRTHHEINKIVAKLPYVQHKGQKERIATPLDPSNLIPSESNYWTYQGSLTTPPCSECVIWIVFADPVEVSKEQLNAFRNLKSYCPEDECPCDEFNGFMKSNFRPPLPLGQRIIRQCKQ